MRFYAPRMRGGCARCANQLPLAASRIAERSAINEAPRTIRTQDSRSPVIHASESGESESSRSRTTRHVKQHRFANPPPPAGSCTVAFPGAVFRYLGSKPSRPGRTKGSFPLQSPGGAPGVLVSARLKCHWSAAVSKASFVSPCADVRGAMSAVRTHLPRARASQTGFDFAPVVKR